MIELGSKVFGSNNNVDWYEGVLENILHNMDRPYSIRLIYNDRLYGFMHIKLTHPAK